MSRLLDLAMYDRRPESVVHVPDMDALATLTFLLLSHESDKLTAEARSSLTAAAEELKLAVVRGVGAKPSALLSAIQETLAAHGLFDAVERRLQPSRQLRAAFNQARNDPAAWTLMSCTTHNPHQVFPGLWIGGMYTAIDKEQLQQMGITHICCCVEEQPAFPDDYTYTVAPLMDRPEFDPTPYFKRTTSFISNALASGGTVLVHCGAGVSRAPTVTAAFLIQVFGMTSRQALNLLERVRPCTYPNSGFIKRLDEFSKVVAASALPNCAAQ